MKDQAAQLRHKLERIGQVKRDSAAEDTRRFLELELGERLLQTVRHCDASISMQPDVSASVPDSESEVWARVRRHLAALR